MKKYLLMSVIAVVATVASVSHFGLGIRGNAYASDLEHTSSLVPPSGRQFDSQNF